MGFGAVRRGGGLLLAAVVAVGLLAAGGAVSPAAAQAIRGGGGEGPEAVKSASALLLDLKASSLPRWWRALAVARLARTQARYGDEESARVLARDAVLLINEPGPDAPPVLGPATVFALLSQAYLDMRDPESSVQLANEALKAIQPVTDGPTRAGTFAFLGLVISEASGADAARPLLLQALRDTATLPAGREQIAALSLIAQAQGKSNDRASAADTLSALTAALGSLSRPGDIALARAHAARAAAAAQNSNAARTHVREAMAAYDRSTQTAEMPMAERVAALGLIALAQNEIGDRSAARQLVRTLKQTLATITESYERFQGLLTLADASFEVERQGR